MPLALRFRQHRLQGPHIALHIGHRADPPLGHTQAADYDILLRHPHTRPAPVHTGLQHHGLAAAGGNPLLRVAVTGGGHTAGVGAEGFDKVVVGSLDQAHRRMARVHHRRQGVEHHRVAVDPGTVLAAERRDLVGSSHLGLVVVDLVEHRQGQTHRVAAVAAAAAVAVEVSRGPAVGRQGVERSRSIRFQTLSKVYRGKMVLFDGERGTGVYSS